MSDSFPLSGPENPEAAEARLLQAIHQAGPVGMTAKQLATLTRLPSETIADRLGALADRRRIARVGRGLWVVSRFEHWNPAEPERFRVEFEREYRLTVGSRTGPVQFRSNESLPVHRWWPYVQGFSAEFVRDTCQRFEVGKGSVVLDPFCGSGTVPTEVRLLGARGIGIDLMPITAFVAAAKQEWNARPAKLRELAERVASDRRPPTLAPPFLKQTRRQFPAEVRATLLRLKEDIGDLPEGPEQRLLRLAFASILIDSSALKRSPCLGYARDKALSGDRTRALFRSAIETIATDLVELQRRRKDWGPRGKIIPGNAGQVPLAPGSVDLAITSPPYVNGMDYVMNYKVDLAWMGFANSYEDLARLRSAMVACDNIPRQLSATHEPSPEVASDPWVRSVREGIDRGVRAKRTYRRSDMGAVVTKYFDDLLPVLRNVHRALRPGGRFVVVNGDSLMAGTYVPGDMIFARLASAVGFHVEEFRVARTRRSGQRRGFLLRESIAVLRRD